MDGRLAILFTVMSLFGGEYHADGINVNRADVGGNFTASLGTLSFDRRLTGQELRLTYAFDQWKRFNPVLDFSITDQGGAWLGVGLYQQFNVDLGDLPLYAGFHFAPGLYMQGNEVDLGFAVEFRSGVELGVRLDNGWQIALSYDHRSNADFSAVNPGLETIQLRFSKSFR